MAVVEFLKGTVASLMVVLAGVAQVEPREADVGQGFDLGTKNSLDAVCVLGAAGPMTFGAQAAQILVPMDSNWLGVEQEVIDLLGPRVAELGLEFVMEAMYSLKVAVAAEAGLKPKVVEAGLVLVSVAMLDEEPDAVVAVPMEVVVGILAELVEPKEVGLVAVVESPMAVEADPLFVIAVPMGAGVAVLFGLDSKLAAFAADLDALEGVPRVADTVAGGVVALEADSKMAELEGSNYLWGVEPVLGSGEADVSPKVAVVGTDLEVVLVVALDLDAMNWWVAVVGLVFALQTSSSQEHVQAAVGAAGRNCFLLWLALVEILAGESMWVVPLLWYGQEPLGEQEERMAQGQVQGLALVLDQGQPLQWGLQQVWTHYFQVVEACPGWSLLAVGTKEESWG